MTHEEPQPNTQNMTPKLRCSTRQRNPPQRLIEYVSLSETVEPNNYNEDIASPQWCATMQSKFDSIIKNETWDLIDLPLGHKPLTTKWVFKIKRWRDGASLIYKARLVARGFKQEEGIDYKETFAPVIKWNTLRLVISKVAGKRWKTLQLDVKIAFLYSLLKDMVLMEQPPGFEVKGHEHNVCLLKKALYGLKQGARAWNDTIDELILSLGLHKCSADGNLYYRIEGENITLLLLYVDDLLITCNNEDTIDNIKHKLTKRYEMSDLGSLGTYLQVEFLSTKQGILMNQSSFVEKMLHQFGMANSSPTTTPIHESCKLTSDMQEETTDATLYRQMIGKLLYLTNRRPDIAFATNVLSRFMQTPQIPHMATAKYLLRYLQGPIDLRILFEQHTLETIEGYTDSDWAGDCEGRRSTSAYVFFMGIALVTWSSRR